MFQKLWPFNASSQQNGSIQANEQQDHGVSTKVKPIHASFNKGIPLNMKIIIRGDIRTGKTSLFLRLQGLPFWDERHYKTTDQIQVANIPWQYPQSKDIIKVEIWDVVDKGLQAGELKASGSNSSGASLKIENNAPTSPIKSKSTSESNSAPHAAFSLDASTIDVYRNTDGVILLYDISKPWTFDYVVKALADIPANMPVLILSNFSDDSHPRPVIASERIEALMGEYNDIRRKQPCAPANLIRHLDTSMKTGLGLKEIHESFGIPFLNVLRETHRKQFEQKTQEINELLQVLDSHDRERSKLPTQQQHQQKQHHVSTQPTSPVETASSKRILSIHTTIHPVPQSISPTSPARKTRNEYTNVDILSPTPVSAQTPAVLFDFNAGKLEEEFFQNSSLDSAAPGATSKKEPIPVASEQPPIDSNEVEIGGNPMVAGDEDIEDSSSDVEVDARLHPEEGDIDQFTGGSLSMGFEAAESSEGSVRGDTPPLRHLTQQDSDIESQPDFPVASAMYYEDEPSAFAQEGPPLSGAMSSTVVSHYEEIADDQGDNPWKSDGDVLNGMTDHGKSAHKTRKDQERQAAEDNNEEPLATGGVQSNGMDNSMIRKKKSIEIDTVISSTVEAGGIDAAEPSPALTTRTESSDADPEEGEDGSSITSTLQEKKKTKKNKKKKGKKREMK